MAFFNEIGAGRYNRFIQKLFNMKGGPPARQLASDVAMMMPFFSGAEHRYLEGWQRYAFRFTLAAGGAGNLGVFQITNPSTSNVIAVFEKIFFANQNAAVQQYVVSYQANGLANLANVQNFGNIGLDFRGQTTPIVQATFKNNSAVAGSGTGIWFAQLPVSGTIDVLATDIHEIPLSPTSTLAFWANISNSILDVSFVWRERALEDSEFK